jgi:hypothetical protein
MEMSGLIHTPAVLPPGIVFPNGDRLVFGACLDALETKTLLALQGVEMQFLCHPKSRLDVRYNIKTHNTGHSYIERE